MMTYLLCGAIGSFVGYIFGALSKPKPAPVSKIDVQLIADFAEKLKSRIQEQIDEFKNCKGSLARELSIGNLELAQLYIDKVLIEERIRNL
jgi:hypothetical protein